jgi:nicotinamide-nucleotide amidase
LSPNSAWPPARSQILLITGGLGPTLDDLTREALAEAFQQPLVRDAESVRRIEALFAARGRTMPERNLCQADRPESAEAIPNDCGTAPGILMQVRSPDCDHDCLIGAMPGVPAEMKPMFLQSIRPRLPSSGLQLCRKVIRTFGYGESEAERLLRDLTARGRNPEVGITASEAVISLWISARSPSLETCAAALPGNRRHHSRATGAGCLRRRRCGAARGGDWSAPAAKAQGGIG